jgi:3-oxoacyl-(acyl-carrier-protein) synthase
MPKANAAVISGIGVYNDLGVDRQALILALSEGRQANRRPFFADDEEAIPLGLGFNPAQIAMPALGKPRRGQAPGDAQNAAELLQRVIGEGLADAGLEPAVLAEPGVQFYLGGQGVQPDIMRFFGYLRRNDEEDLLFNPAIRHLHSSHYSEEHLARLLVRHYGLAVPPLSLNSASCSSMSALYVASRAIASGSAELAVVASWQQVSLYNLLFMGGLNALAKTVYQPFAAGTEGVMLGAGMSVVILESAARLKARGGRGRMRIDGFAMSQNSGSARGGQAFAPDFRLIARTIGEALEQAEVAPEQVGCVFAHGNGIRGNDQAELMAIRKVWGDNGVPTVSYKAQLGYQVSASGLTDLAIAADALEQRRLLAFRASVPLDAGAGVHLHANSDPLAIDSEKLVKIGLGIEGSIAACSLARIA